MGLFTKQKINKLRSMVRMIILSLIISSAIVAVKKFK